MILYGAGRWLGPTVFRTRLISRLVSVENRNRAHVWLNRNTALAVLTSRFVSGLRLPTYLAAGAVRTDALQFAFWFLVASVIWTPLLVGAAAFSIESLSVTNLLIGLIAAIVFIRMVQNLANWKKRRLLFGKLKRIVNWEFWPLPVFYAPVVVYIGWLAIRHQSLTVFTAANPSMPAGGFVGESKDRIYELINSSPGAEPHLLRHVKLKASQSLPERILSVVTFIAKNGLDYPLVIKPDVGERGKGVAIVRDKESLAMLIRHPNHDLILQDFCGGVEASVFYYRIPGETRGHVFSITEKQFPKVTGDGRSTVEELIFSDQRAVCIAKEYFRHQPGRLDRIPAAGEKISLIDIGTHSRGAVFLDGEWLRTIQLEDSIDAVSRGIDGFYFGRYDVRAESFDDLRAGKFKIIELNGVTSESTNIYDPRNSLLGAYRILFRQWRLAFTIGAANAERGVRPVSSSEFLRLLITRNASRLASAVDDDKLHAAYPNPCA